MESPAAIRRRRRRRVPDENRKRAPRACDRCKTRKSKFEKSRGRSPSSPSFHEEPPSSAQSEHGISASDGHAREAPEENISIESPEVFSPASALSQKLSKHVIVDQTTRLPWPNIFCRLREAFSLNPHTTPEEQDMVAMQAHMTCPKEAHPSELARLRLVVKAFPPRPVANFLLSVFIKHATDAFFYFDQSQFLAEIDQLYTDSNSHLRCDPSFVCLAMAAFALGSQWTPLERPEGLDTDLHRENVDLGRVFYCHARTLIPDIIDKPSLWSIQAPMVLSVYLLPASAIGSSYVYMGLALRKALAFDLHQDIDDPTTDEREKEVRRRLWWSIYSLERCTTIKLNRPRSINADTITAILPSPNRSLDRLQKFDNLQFQLAFIHLVKILDQIAEPTDPLKHTERLTRYEKCESDLQQWKKSLPQEFKLEKIDPRDSKYRAVFHLYLNYYYAWISMGKVFLVTVVRTNLNSYFYPKPQPPHINETVNKLSLSCTKAARKLLQLFENLTHTRNITRFSFTDFQGCSIATIVTLVSGILVRDSTYHARVAFGLDCLRKMATGNMTAKMGVKFVEAVQSIANEAARKLHHTSSFQESIQVTGGIDTTSEYSQWAEWLTQQENIPQGDSTPASGGGHTTTMEITAQDGTWTLPQPSVNSSSWGIHGADVPPTVPFSDNFTQQTTFSHEAHSAENSFISALHSDDQTFLMGLTGLDGLDLLGFTSPLE
ncbi:fungal-specific transcription factor domain-containing protein [Penicillium riverlandense]|uniref:fungal-specific transcription factor domain-containing protein n=1 Tax=Penicillium riverlandense TaxID=1903569 RepID=UPI0025496B22|nr:fungal-specific transcription factor domain-containing protein [Penicillium riverlandense]KAJ5832765.1 fungal-specific transcription factor domain-containing protein [Penicillium riverlandense]